MLAALDTDGAGIRSGYNYWYSNSLLAYDRGSFNPSHTFFQYGYGTLSSDLAAAYDDVGNRTELTAVLDTSGVPEPAYQNRYGYDRLYRMTSVTQSFVPHSGNPQIPATLALAVAPKRIDFQYDPASQLEQLTRFEDLAGTELVAQSSFVFDAASRLTDMTHSRSATVFADYDWDYDAGNRLEQFVSLADGTVDYNYDDRSQLTGADYTGANLPADESYTYDANGNRELANGAAYQTDPNNRLADDGTYTYEYDDEGNLTKRTTISDGSYIDYTWDHRNRLTQIGERTSAGGTVKDAHYTYDAFDRRIAKAIVEPGQPTDNFVFVYDGEHIAMALRYDDVGQEYELANRYLHGPSVDMILADEQVTDASQEGNVLWPLTDNLGSVRDIADYDAASDVTTITNHLVYDSFGNIASETNAAIDHIFGYTGRERDQESDLHYNRARYYDPRTARFVSEDPIGFSGGDPNLHRYVGNSPTVAVDPSGLATIPLSGGGEIAPNREPRISQAVAPRGELLADATNTHDVTGDESSNLRWDPAWGHRPTNRQLEDLRDDYERRQKGQGRLYKEQLRAWELRSIPKLSEARLGENTFDTYQQANRARFFRESRMSWAMTYLAWMLAPGQATGNQWDFNSYMSNMFGFAPGAGINMAPLARLEPLRMVVENGVWESPHNVPGTVFSGHGAPSGGFFTVPRGTSVTVPLPMNSTIGSRANVFENGLTPTFPAGSVTYLPGARMPNLILSPVTPGMRVVGSPFTVTTPTPLSSLVRPNMGNCVWAACTVNASP